MFWACVLIMHQYAPLAGTREVLGNRKTTRRSSFILFPHLKCCSCRRGKKMDVLLHSQNYINCCHVFSLAFFIGREEMGTQHSCMSHKHLSLSVSCLINRRLQLFWPFLILRPPKSLILYFIGCLEVTNFPHFYCIWKHLSFRHEIQNVIFNLFVYLFLIQFKSAFC